MDELPREAKELLALVQDAHDPPDEGARSRVKHGVLLAAAAGGGAAALASKAVASAATSAASTAVTGAAKTGLFASATAKMFLAGSAIVVASAVTVAVPRMSTHERKAPQHEAAATHKPRARMSPRSARPEPVVAEAASAAVEQPAAEQPLVQPPVAQLGVPLIEAAGQSAGERAQVAQRASRPHVHRSTGPSLEAEMKLLQAASDAIAAHDVARARALLGEHRKTFPQGQLRAEREGLLTLAACTQGSAAAQKQARTFLRKEPTAVLSARIRSACKLDEKP